jgi:hypothetical protein
VNSEDALFHEHVRPHGLEQLVFGDEASAATNERDQQVESLRRQTDGPPVPGETPIGNVESKGPLLTRSDSAFQLPPPRGRPLLRTPMACLEDDATNRLGLRHPTNRRAADAGRPG